MLMRLIVLAIFCITPLPVAGADGVAFDRDVLSLLKARCVKCHGPVKREAKLNLASPRGLAQFCGVLGTGHHGAPV